MNVKPIGDRVVVRQLEAEEKTKSGIILTSTNKEKPPIFEVVVVGDGVQNDGTEVKMIVKAGDKVVANKYTGSIVKLDDEELIVLKQSDIVALILD